MIVLDTNVLSEAGRPTPARQVMAWLAEQPPMLLFTTTISEAEFLYGLALLPKGRRRASLEDAARRLFSEDFADRVLPFDSAAARSYAEIVAARRRQGRPIAALDAQIAAIAHSRGAAVATRDVADFRDCGLRVIDPWSA